jgi:hypothetical protein
MRRQLADRLLVARVRPELGSGPTEKLIFFTGLGQLDLDTADRLAECVIDNRTLVPAKRSDSVARTQEREVALHHLVKQGPQLRLNSTLGRSFDILRIAGLERPAAQDDSRPLIKINSTELGLFHPESAQLSFVEATEAEHGGILFVGRDILGPNGKQQEGLHDRTLRD